MFALTPFERAGVAAEYALVPVEELVAGPRSLGPIGSAAIPLTGLTNL